MEEINTKLGNIISANIALNKLYTMDLPIRSAFMLEKMISCLNADMESFNKANNKIMLKYGTPSDDDPNKINFSKTNKENYDKDLNALLETDVLVPIGKVNITIADNIRLSAFDIKTLRQFVNFVEEGTYATTE